VTAGPINQSPAILTNIPDTEIEIGGAPFSYLLTEAFEDPDGDPMTFSASSLNSDVISVSVVGNALIAVALNSGEAIVTVSASDVHGDSVSQSFTATVPPVNHPPDVIAEIPDTEIEIEGPPFTYDLSLAFADPDDDALSFEVDEGMAGVVEILIEANAINVTGLVPGETMLTVTASDPEGLSVSQGFLMTVLPVTGIENPVFSKPFVSPNPFSKEFSVTYYLRKPGPVSFKMADMNGKALDEVVVNDIQSPGKHQIVYNKETLPPGTYLYKLVMPERVFVGKVIKLW
jgi:hypothetical protein